MSPRWGGPKWPRRRIPVIRKPRRVWVANGVVDSSTTNAGILGATSSLYDDPSSSSGPFTTIMLPATSSPRTLLIAPLLSSFDDHAVEANDFASVNDDSALADNMRVHRIQGFFHLRTAQLLDYELFGWALAKLPSYSGDGLDPVDLPDPTLWRSESRLIHQEYFTIRSDTSYSTNSGYVRNINMRLHCRLKKQEYLNFYLYVPTMAGPVNAVELTWGLRCLVSR